jgi:hypothetical protein
MRIFRFFSACILALIIFGFFPQAKNCCRKPDPPKAVVTVIFGEDIYNYQNHIIYNKDAPAAGATVIVYSSENSGYYDPGDKVLADTAIADGNGQTHHEFKYESIYSVKAWLRYKYTSSVYDTLWGEGALILKEDETYPETVRLRCITQH